MTDARETRVHATEFKFIVDPSIGERLRHWARSYLAADPHGTGSFADEYTTTTVYWDTSRHDVFHRRGSYGRAKYRIRRYDSADSVFLERKLRRPRMLIKRRTRVPLSELGLLDHPVGEVGWPGNWFKHRLDARGLRPVCQLSYRRMARGLATDLGLARLTLDQSIHARAVSGLRFDDDPGLPVLSDRLILELKFLAEIPTQFTRLIEEFGLNPLTASKYRLGMAMVAGLSLTKTPVPSAPAVGSRGMEGRWIAPVEER